MQGLEGLRVLELGDRVSAAYAAKVLADVGADVVKLEEPGGDVTEIAFRDLVVNPPLDDAAFAP